MLAIKLAIKVKMRKVILFGVPTHGNIGDAAIVIAEEKFIKDNLNKYEYIKVLDDETKEKIKEMKNIIKDEDIILLHGGGNLGDEYMICEERRRMVIDAFPNNKIILMPQSIYFSDTEFGKKELENTKKLYNNHKHLTLVAREEVSFNIMKKEFPNTKVILTPDIVMYLNKTQNTERHGVILAMRRDIEKVLTAEQMEKINDDISKYFESKTMTDTHLGEAEISCEMREKVVEDKLEEFRKSQLVITDRLHGMIFAAITSTPCIALGNYNHKIESSFEWLRHKEYIKFLKDTKDLEEAIIELKDKNINYNNEFAVKEYRKILDIINN